MKNKIFGISAAMLLMFQSGLVAEAAKTASLKGVFEDTTLKNTSLAYDTSGGYSDTLSLAKTISSSSRTRILVRIPMKEYSNAEFFSDGILTFKIKTPPKKNMTVNIYEITDVDSDWKSAEISGLGDAAAGYACSSDKKRDSDSRGGKYGYYTDRIDDATAWTGGYILGNPGSGSYATEPFASVALTSTDTELTFTVPMDILEKWKTDNSGFVMRLSAETGTADTLELYSSNSENNSPEFTFLYDIKEFKVNNLKVVDSYGKEIPELYRDMDGLNVSATVENRLYKTVTPRIFCSVYDNDGKLKLAAATDGVAVENENTADYSLHITKEQLSDVTEDDLLKIMIWDGETMVPLTLGRTAERELPEQKVTDFAASSGHNNGMTKLGIYNARMDFSWAAVEPEKGKFNENVLKSWGDHILSLKKEGIELLPILDYTAPWAVEKGSFTYDYDQAGTIKITRGPLENNNGVSQRDITTNKKGTVTVQENVNVDVTKEPFGDVEDWKRYVEKIVSTYSAPPYNLEYFQIWNEAHPASGFFNGDMVWYMKNIHIPAAEIIQKYGCKVVYGGWPCCGSVTWYTSLITQTDAWDKIDVFDMHYLGSWDVSHVYNEALKNGVISPSVWQTEVGFTGDTLYIPQTYPYFLDEALKRRSEKESQFRYYYFTYASPDDPNAYGYGACMFAGNRITGHGKAQRIFYNLLNGDSIERFTRVGFESGVSALYSFEVDGERVVTYLHGGSVENIRGKKLYYEGISGVTSAKLFDVYGDTEINLKWIDTGNHTGYVTIPANYENGLFYVSINADRIIPPENNIADFELGSDNNGRSLVAAGRWSYLDENMIPLQKGTGTGSFSVNEWALDNYNKVEHAWCLDSSGRVFTDTRTMYYNYTVNKEQAGKSLTISGTFSGGGYNKVLAIYKTTDKSEFTFTGTPELIYTASTTDSKSFSVNIPAEDVEFGNDIAIGLYSNPGGTWFIPAKVDATITTN